MTGPPSTARLGRFIVPLVILLTLVSVAAWFALRLDPGEQRVLLQHWEFWWLEGLFGCVVATTAVAVRRAPPDRRLLLTAAAVGALACLLSSSIAPRTNRIYYDEQIYQGVGQNLTDLKLAQMCNDGTVEYGRLQCWRSEFNKEPNGYPYLLSLVYRAVGVGESGAFIFNIAVAGASAFLVVVLGAMLFDDRRAAVLAGVVLTLLPMQLWWTRTAAAEPSAAMWCAASLAAVIHFTRARTTTALACAVAVTAFATTLRPESVLVVPLAMVAILLRAADELRRPRLWWAAAAGAALSLVTLLHLAAVRHENWGTTAARLGWHYVPANFAANFWFYWGYDERFPVLFSITAIVGLRWSRRFTVQVLLASYFLLFWGIFLVFYAGSYDYGADVRYSLLSHVPLALLAGGGLGRLIQRLSRRWPERTVVAVVVAALVLQFSWYAPVARSIGEEAWAARADVRYAKGFAARLPANSLVLTHNPSLFHLWGINAAQLSLAATDPAYVRTQLFNRYAGGVYLHWNFWCNVRDPVQAAFCRTALESFPAELVESARERDYHYAMYRLGRARSVDDARESGLQSGGSGLAIP
jgi:hypothetical protein